MVVKIQSVCIGVRIRLCGCKGLMKKKRKRNFLSFFFIFCKKAHARRRRRKQLHRLPTDYTTHNTQNIKSKELKQDRSELNWIPLTLHKLFSV